MAEPALNPVEELKRRAKAGDLQALQALRERGLLGGGGPAARGWPVSHAQRRLWIVEQMADGSGAYHIPIALRLTGRLDAEALREALRLVVERHESLRTRFAEVAGELRQFIHDEARLDWQAIDLTADPEPESRARRLAAEHAARPFDLAAGPLLRAALLRLGADEHILLFNIHHIVADLLSLGVLVGELSAAYEARAAGRMPELPPLPIQYKDFAAWQNRQLAGEAGARHRAYWLRQLAGPLTPLDLPTDFRRPPLKTFRGGLRRTRLDPALTERLRQLGARRGMSLFMVLAAVLKVLLHRYTGQEDVIVGFPLAGRDHPDLAGQIGCFVNTVALRDRLAAEDGFEAVLAGVRQTALDAYAHQAYPFDRLVEELGLPRDMSRSPVFDVSISLANAGGEALRFGGVGFAPWEDGFASSKFDLSFDFYETADSLELAIAYAADLFTAERAGRMAGHFQRLAESATLQPGLAIGLLPWLTAEEERRVLVDFAGARRTFPADLTLAAWFERQAAQTPDRIALVWSGGQGGDEVSGGPRRTLSYAELNTRANRLAHRLRRLGIQPGRVVGLYLERSLDTVVAILGALKAGAAYLPLDAGHPAERLAFALADAAAPVLVTQTRLLEKLPGTAARRLCIDGDWDAIAGESAENPPPLAGPDDLAYLIYTSGSTGRPKGVRVSHANAVRLFTATGAWFRFGPDDVWTLFHSYAFDFSVWEIWGALLHGGRLVVPSYWAVRTPETFHALLADEGVTVLNQTPSAFRQLIHWEEQAETPAPLALRWVIFGGEALEFSALAPWFARHGDQRPRLVNMYGITETTVHVTYRPLAAADARESASLIGRPIPDLYLRLLDRHLRPVPVGVPGEICVGGAGVAQGYLNRPELTAERFIADPWGEGRLYRSGDLGRWREDGDLEYLGRLDHQVQLRGYRVELGEIEAALLARPEVREAVVLAREDRPGSLWLVGYVTPAVGGAVPDAGALREHLRARLPDYMVPARFLVLDEFPLTPNKKIDRNALPVPADRPEDAVSFIPPRDDLEHILAGLFAEILRVERVGAEDNFFELGGDSLLATRIVSRLRETFRADLGIPRLFRAGNVAGLALALRELLPEGRADKVAAALRRLQGMSDAERAELLKKKQRT